MKKFEYMMCKYDNVQDCVNALNDLGDDGWEVVASVGDVQGGDGFVDGNFTEFVFVLKREK